MARVDQFSQAIYTATLGTSTSTPTTKLGTPLYFPDGRIYRYAQAGGSNIAAARVVQEVVPTSDHNNLTVTAAVAAGLYTVNVTLGATAVVANEYADGFMYVNDAGADTTTEGYLYRIKSHAAAAASANVDIVLYDDSPIKIALTTNSQVTLQRNAHRQVIIHPSPPTAKVVGVTPTAVVAYYYFWAQTAGPCVVLTDGTITINQQVVASPSTDGAVSNALLTEATPNTFIQPILGTVIVVNASTEESLIQLMGIE